MRKRIVQQSHTAPTAAPGRWLDLEQIATVEVTSEDPGFPVESAFQSGDAGAGWRAAEDGEQLLRVIFDEPTSLNRIQLQFAERVHERTQEFVIRWSPAQGGQTREVVRQQFNFSPSGSPSEIEDYDVNLDRVSVLELAIRPDLNHGQGRATLLKWRVG
jgi:uncharacterized protein (DUF736 family)